MSGDECEELLEAAPGKVTQRLFASAQDHINSDFVSFFKEFVRLLGAEFEVVASSLEADAEHFYFTGMLFGSMSSFFTRLFVFKLPEVHDFDHGRVGSRSDLNHIEPTFFGDGEGFLKGDFAQILAVLVNSTDTRHADLVVDTETTEYRGGLLTIKREYGCYYLIRSTPEICHSSREILLERDR